MNDLNELVSGHMNATHAEDAEERRKEKEKEGNINEKKEQKGTLKN